LFAALCTVIPFFYGYVFYKRFDRADTPESRAYVGALYESLDLKDKNKGRKVILVPVFFHLRRLILVVTIIYLQDYLEA